MGVVTEVCAQPPHLIGARGGENAPTALFLDGPDRRNYVSLGALKFLDFNGRH